MHKHGNSDRTADYRSAIYIHHRMRAIQNQLLITPGPFSSSYTDNDARRIEQPRCEIASVDVDPEGKVSGAERENKSSENKYRGVLLAVPMSREEAGRMTRNPACNLPHNFF